MEAATPLRAANVRTLGDRLVVDGLVVQDECAVRLVREREEAGEDPARIVGAVLDAWCMHPGRTARNPSGPPPP